MIKLSDKQCSRCGDIKSVSEFKQASVYKDGFHCWCLPCLKKYNREYRAKNRDHFIEVSKSRWHNLGLNEKAICYIKQRHKRYQLKIEVYSHYSGGKPKCNYCGFEDIRGLCIDHINDNGAVHRKEVCHNGNGARSAPNITDWLRKNNYPEGFQVLCSNCNTIKEYKRRQQEYLKKTEAKNFG